MWLLKKISVCYYSLITIMRLYFILGKVCKGVRAAGGLVDLNIKGSFIFPYNDIK